MTEVTREGDPRATDVDDVDVRLAFGRERLETFLTGALDDVIFFHLLFS